MPKLGRTTPCNDCPWRRNSMPGWLGAADPEQFEASQRGQAMPCHKDIDYEDEDWELTQLPDADLCAGGMTYLANALIMPYGDELKKAREACSTNERVNETIFSSRQEFIDHHRKFGHGSWDYA